MALGECPMAHFQPTTHPPPRPLPLRAMTLDPSHLVHVVDAVLIVGVQEVTAYYVQCSAGPVRPHNDNGHVQLALFLSTIIMGMYSQPASQPASPLAAVCARQESSSLQYP